MTANTILVPMTPLFRYAKFPSKLIGFVLVPTGFPFAIGGQCALAVERAESLEVWR